MSLSLPIYASFSRLGILSISLHSTSAHPPSEPDPGHTLATISVRTVEERHEHQLLHLRDLRSPHGTRLINLPRRSTDHLSLSVIDAMHALRERQLQIFQALFRPRNETLLHALESRCRVQVDVTEVLRDRAGEVGIVDVFGCVDKWAAGYGDDGVGAQGRLGEEAGLEWEVECEGVVGGQVGW